MAPHVSKLATYHTCKQIVQKYATSLQHVNKQKIKLETGYSLTSPHRRTREMEQIQHQSNAYQL